MTVLLRVGSDRCGRVRGKILSSGGGTSLGRRFLDISRRSPLYGRSAQGPVLECGTGLTTLVLAAVGADVWALENNDSLASKGGGETDNIRP